MIADGTGGGGGGGNGWQRFFHGENCNETRRGSDEDYAIAKRIGKENCVITRKADGMAGFSLQGWGFYIAEPDHGVVHDLL